MLDEVIDLSIEDDPHGTIFVAHRFTAFVGQIDDRETPVSEPNSGFDMQARRIGPAVRERVADPRNHYRVDAFLPIAVNYSADSAHFIYVR